MDSVAILESNLALLCQINIYIPVSQQLYSQIYYPSEMLTIAHRGCIQGCLFQHCHGIGEWTGEARWRPAHPGVPGAIRSHRENEYMAMHGLKLVLQGGKYKTERVKHQISSNLNTTYCTMHHYFTF